jgi:uncharacterized membrane protein
MFTAEASVTVQADQQRVWEYVSNYMNFDKFMSHVKEIRMLSGDTSEWHLSGPLGIPVSWQAITSVKEPPRHLAWHSVKGSIDTKGFIKLEGEGAGTKITVHVEYTPPGGAAGEAFANIFKDPQKMLEEDLKKLGEILSGQPVQVGEGRKGMAGGNSGSMKQQGDGQQGMLTNVTDFAMDKPLVTLLSAVAIGFVLGRVTSRHD